MTIEGQDWKGVDGAIAFHLIDRHAEDWNDTGRLMDEWRKANSSPDSNVEAVREKLLQRSIVGLKKYGVTTERDDLSDLHWLIHLHEEIMDASVYIQKIISRMEADGRT